MSLNEKKIYSDIIDLKQRFVNFDSLNCKKGHIYEFNFKTTNNIPFDEEKINEYLELFSSIRDQKLSNQCAVHFTGLSGDTNTAFKFYKLNIGLTTKVSLADVEKVVDDIHQSFFNTDEVKLLSKRIVKNKNNVTSEDYFLYLDFYLNDEFPSYKKKQKTFS